MYPGVDVGDLAEVVVKGVGQGFNKQKEVVLVMDDLHVVGGHVGSGEGGQGHVLVLEWVRRLVERREITAGDGQWVAMPVGRWDSVVGGIAYCTEYWAVCTGQIRQGHSECLLLIVTRMRKGGPVFLAGEGRHFDSFTYCGCFLEHCFRWRSVSLAVGQSVSQSASLSLILSVCMSVIQSATLLLSRLVSQSVRQAVKLGRSASCHVGCSVAQLVS